jgi:hypothetical protein
MGKIRIPHQYQQAQRAMTVMAVELCALLVSSEVFSRRKIRALKKIRTKCAHGAD